jgi:hypothetical protein
MRAMQKSPPRSRGSTLRWFVGFLAIVGALAGLEIYSLVAHNHERAVAVQTAAAPASKATGPEGAVDAPAAEAVVGPRVTVSGWALDASGIRAVEIRVDGKVFPARIGIERLDVGKAKPGMAAGTRGGFEWSGDLSTLAAVPGADRRTLSIVAVAKDGHETLLGKRSVIDPAALSRWTAFAAKGAPAFHLLPALSGLDLGGAVELDTIYTPYLSPTVRAGFRVPVLYLRTTKGAAGDYAFDPDWDPTRKCGERRIADDSLGSVLMHAREKKLPVLVTLNGGIWADAFCDVPQWDVNDKLEQDVRNCQWNENNEVMPDDMLKTLPGSLEAPELARSLTFNVYASEVRHYKKRNLQQAGALLAAFARENPELFVGVNLDPDTYMNPFFAEKQWYDYNPNTLRQFREWLAGTGPYAGHGGNGVPDLRAYRRAKPLTLAEVSALAGKHWKSWQEVDPPRQFPRDGERPFWKDPWVHEWEYFRRHLVHLHYDELAKWLVEAGVSRDHIWSSQGLMAPRGDSMAFAIELDSPTRNYDSGGMSIRGAKPELGHLGVILYGEAAVNDVPMDNGKSLFATLASVDPSWAVVEYNTADLRDIMVPPAYPAAYRGLRDLWNYGARFVSPMAWNGSNGLFVGQPGYSTFTAWRNTPLEAAARDFMLARAGLPLGSLLWTFGTPTFADGDGWTADIGTLALGNGFLVMGPDANDRMAIVSPKGLPASVQRAETFVLGLDEHAGVRRVRIQGRAGPDGGWETLADASAGAFQVTSAGIAVKRRAGDRGFAIDQLRIEITFAANTSRKLARVAVL